MSLKAFGKGFFGAAGPSFVRGMQQEQGRIDVRRQEDRQDAETKRREEREDLLLVDTRGREDADKAYENAKIDLLGASNESTEAVESVWSGFSPELHKRLGGIKNQYITKAARMKRNRELDIEGKRATIDASGAQSAAAKIRGQKDQFTLEEAESRVSGRKQYETLKLTDDDGLSAASAAFLDLTKDGITHANAPAAANIAKAIDAYLGSSEYSVRVQQGKASGDDLRTENGIMGNLAGYAPDMIINIANKMGDGPSRDRLLVLAGGKI